MPVNQIRNLWFCGALAVVVLLFILLKPILTPFVVGALLAYLGDPFADKLEQWGLGRTSAVSVVFFCLTLLLLIVLLLTVPLVGRQLDILTNKAPLWMDDLQETAIPWLQQRMGLPDGSLNIDKLKDVLSENWAAAGGVLGQLSSKLAGSSLAVLTAIANLVLIPVVSFYLLRDWDVLMLKAQNLLPRSAEPVVVRLLKECDEIIGAFIRGQLLVMLALGTIYSLGLWIVGVDLALILGLVAGLASIVPYMGFIVGIVAAGVATWFQFHELTPLLGVGAVFIVGQMLEGMVLTPLLVGDRIGLHPVAVIFVIMAGGQLAGFIGILLALPVAAVIMVLLRYLHSYYKESVLYGGKSEAGSDVIVVEAEPETVDVISEQ